MTTADAFTEAAKAATLDYAKGPTRTVILVEQRAFLDGAEWARAHLAAQEPTDAEQDARALFEWDTEDHPEPKPTWEGLTGGQRDVWRSAITALSAARAARRDEENR